MQLVKVRYIFGNENTLRESSREYTYFSEESLALGDIVIVPVKDSTGKAKVTAIDVPEAEIEHFRAAVKTIPAGSMVPMETVTKAKAVVQPEDVPSVETQTVAIRINPRNDILFAAYKDQAMSILDAARAGVINNDADLNAETNDLVIIRGLKKGIEEARLVYAKPLTEYTKTINDTFKELSNPVDEADVLISKRMIAYSAVQTELRRKAEEINREKETLARKEAEFNGTGEVTINTTPVIVPAAPAAHIRAEMGTAGTIKTRKARVIDFSKLPDTYKLPNERLLTTAASTGVQEIPGVEFYVEDSIRITGRR